MWRKESACLAIRSMSTQHEHFKVVVTGTSTCTSTFPGSVARRQKSSAWHGHACEEVRQLKAYALAYNYQALSILHEPQLGSNDKPVPRLNHIIKKMS